MPTPKSLPQTWRVLHFVLIGAAACAAVGVSLGLTGLARIEYQSLPRVSHSLLLGLYGAVVGGAVGGTFGTLVKLVALARPRRGKENRSSERPA